MHYRSLILSSFLVISSCSVMDVFSLFTPSKGLSVDAELTVGDKSEEIATGAVIGNKETTNNTAEEISQVFNTVNEAEPLLPWLVAMLFLMLPTPTRMYMGIKSLFRRKK